MNSASLLRPLVRLVCVAVAMLALTLVPSASFADDVPAVPGDDSSTGTGTDDSTDDGGDAVEGDGTAPTGDGTEGGNDSEVTGAPDQAGVSGGSEVEGGEVLIVENGGISVPDGAEIEGEPVMGVLTGVLTSTSDESGAVAYQVRRYGEAKTFISTPAAVRVTVSPDDDASAPGDAAKGSDDSAAAALPNTGAASNLKPVLAAGIYFLVAGLVVVCATRPQEFYVPAPVVRRRPRVNWE